MGKTPTSSGVYARRAAKYVELLNRTHLPLIRCKSECGRSYRIFQSASFSLILFVSEKYSGLKGFVALAAHSDCDWTILDEAAAHFAFAGANSSMPVTVEELDEVCSLAEQAISLCEAFTKDCTSGLETAMITIFLDAAKKDRQERCVTNREEYLKVAPCLQAEASRGLRKCNVRQAGYLQAVLKKEKKDRVALACCYQKQYELCITKASEVCGKTHVKYAKKVVSTMSAELKDTACRKFTRNPDLCDDVPAVKPVRHPMFSTIIPALVKIVGAN